MYRYDDVCGLIPDSDWIANGIYEISFDSKKIDVYGDDYYAIYSFSIPENLTADSLINDIKLGLAAERTTPSVFKIIVKSFEEHIEEIVQEIGLLRKNND
jgi:hypothetical protein